MASFPVVWTFSGEGPVAGRLELGDTSLRLEGGERSHEQRIEVSYDEIVGLGRSSERVGPLAALRLDGREVGTLLIAAFSGAALNGEILEQLQRALESLL